MLKKDRKNKYRRFGELLGQKKSHRKRNLLIGVGAVTIAVLTAGAAAKESDSQ